MRPCSQYRDRDAVHMRAVRLVGARAWWEERTDVFLHHALDLLQEVAVGTIRAPGIELKDIGAIVVNTITVLAIPSLDAKLMNRLDLPCCRAPANLRAWLRRRRCRDLHARLAMRRRCPERTLCFSPSIFAVFAFASTIRACGCSCRRRCSAMAPRASCSATKARGPRPGVGESLPRGIIFGATPSHIMGWDIRHDGFGYSWGCCAISATCHRRQPC